MDLKTARERLVFVLKEIVRVSPDRIKAYYDWRVARIDAIGEKEERIKREYAQKFQLDDSEIRTLENFFDPLLIHENMSGMQVHLCLALYENVYPPGTLMKDGLIFIIREAAMAPEVEAIGDDFPAVLQKVFEAKLDKLAQWQQSMTYWKSVLRSMSIVEREKFLREFGDRLPFLRGIDLD